jgi:3-dehydroquinate synthase
VGVNHALGKNMIGAFHQPVFVWIDTEYLKTLPQREIVCGLGEVVKYGIIRDAELFQFLESHVDAVRTLDADAVVDVLSRCAAIKADVVSQDEKESGIRIILNCGHTIGHGLEYAGHFRLLKHGEAVLLGIIAESYISKEMNILNARSFERIAALIKRIPIKANLSSLKIADVVSAIGRDKKHVGAKLRFVVPVKIGEVNVIDGVSPSLIRSVVRSLLKN